MTSKCPELIEKIGKEPREVRPLYIPFKATLNANEKRTLQYEFPLSYAYRWEALTYTSDGEFTISIKDGGENDFLMPEDIHIDNIAGIGMMPAFLPCPYIFTPGSYIEVIVKDISGATNNIEVVFWGYKLLL